MIARRKTMAGILAAVVMGILWLPAGVSAGDGLDRGKTKKYIKAAEERMAEYRMSNKLVKAENGGPNFVVDEENPLAGKTGVFKARFDKDLDGLVIVHNKPIKVGTEVDQSGEKRMVVGTFRTNLKKFFDYDRMYSEMRIGKMQFKEQVKNLRHVLKVRLPAGHDLPQKTPNHFTATLRVTAVEWDRAAALPVMVIHTDLIKSKAFGLKD